MESIYPKLEIAERLLPNAKRLLIAAYGFEERSLGWINSHEPNPIIDKAIIIRYKSPKGENKIIELKRGLKKIGVTKPDEIVYDLRSRENFENILEERISSIVNEFDEIILDITALTKFLILLVLCKIEKYDKVLRIVYTEAQDYAPTLEVYNDAKSKIERAIKFPSKGFGQILRAKCLSSIRMQGQPVTLIAFTSFNEQLVRHMLGTISPHDLLFINGRPLRDDYEWREKATLSLHMKLVKEYPTSNIVNDGILKRTVSTLFYSQTIDCLDEIYNRIGLYERIIVAATGSKMQTVGLFFFKEEVSRFAY